MSAEAPKRTGITAPNTPREPQGCLPGFLIRFFGQTQAFYRSPIGLENLDRLVTKEVGHVQYVIGLPESALAKKERREREEAEKRAKMDKYLEQYMNERIKAGIQTFEEIWPLAVKLRIRERLNFINAHVWEGKGKVRDISTNPQLITREVVNRADWEARAGFELSYSYSAVDIERERVSNECAKWRSVQGLETACLIVAVTKRGVPHVGSEEGPFIEIAGCSSGNSALTTLVRKIRLDQGDEQGNGEKLDQILAEESAKRVRVGAIPSKLILYGQEQLRDAKASPQWKKWQYSYDYTAQNSGG